MANDREYTVEEMQDWPRFNTTVERCPRCGNRHYKLDFFRFKNLVEGCKRHWAMCPTLNEPLIMEVAMKIQEERKAGEN